MTKREIMTLLAKKIKEHEAESDKDWGINTCAISNYEYGVARGIEIAREILGMLDKPNRLSSNTQHQPNIAEQS